MVGSGNGLRYFSLFGAQLDAVFAALSVLKHNDKKIVVTKTSWPSLGDTNLADYNGN